MSHRVARFTYQAVRSEGGMLPHELLEQVGAHSAELGISSTAYYLAEHEPLGEAQSRAWLRLAGLWRSFKAERAKLSDTDAAVRLTRERWLLPLFHELGYGRLTTAKGGLIVDGREFPISHIHAPAVPLHLMGAGVSLDRRTPGVSGAAQTSPHGLVQDFLNRSEPHLWGVVSNGLVLRLLRDSHTFTRRPYLEFDLEAIFDGELFSDFRLLWLCAHASRLSPAEATPEDPRSAAIEHWFTRAKDEGVRVRDRLRDGVQQAIERLGAGFLRHPQNTGLHQALQRGELSPQDYYRQLLRLVYRLIFVFVAEDRGVLQPPIADDLAAELAAERRRAQDRYTRYYATAKLRELALRRRGSVHGDRWIALRLILARLHRGCPELDLPSLGSSLFNPATTPDLERAELANQELLHAIRALCTFTDQAGVLRQVNWQNIGADELGSVFESLLELVPSLHRETGVFTLATAAGNERKTTGSYYTPESLVECLLDSALDPVLDRACADAQPERALLDLKVCDPACGSGHFVVAAGRRIAHRLAQVRAGDEEPSPVQRRRAFRDVYARCLYGVDLNPMAVELCKVSLWMEAIDPERPLPFLDGHIVRGNSLLGATPALIAGGIPDDAFKPIEGDDGDVAKRLRKRNRDERTGKAEGVQRGLLLAGGSEGTAVLDHSAHRKNASAIEAMADDTLAATEAKERRYYEYLSSDGVRELQLVADTWCSAFVWPKYGEHEESAPTHWVFEKIKREPGKASREMVAVVTEVAREYAFLHWHLVFPQVFSVPRDGERAEHVKCGWSGGFDVVLGNPPWDQIELDPRKFFAASHPQIANAQTANSRAGLISKLKREDPVSHSQYALEIRRTSAVQNFIHQSSRFPLSSHGRLNTAPMFVELAEMLRSIRGATTAIVPLGILTDSFSSPLFGSIVDEGHLTSVLGFENESLLFPAVHHAFKFCILSLAGHRSDTIEAAFFLRHPREARDPHRKVVFSQSDFTRLNPETKTCPILRSQRDLNILRKLCATTSDGAPLPASAWGFRGLLMFMMGGDSSLFSTKEDLIHSEVFGNLRKDSKELFIPLYEGKMIAHFDHRFGTYSQQSDAQSNMGKLPEISDRQHEDPTAFPDPRYWVPDSDVNSRLKNASIRWLLCWRDICRSTDTRTLIPAIIPRVGAGHTLPAFLLEQSAPFSACLFGNLASFVLDYASRQKVSGAHLTLGVMKQLPILPPTAYDAPTPWHPTTTLADWVLPRVLELTYTAWDLIGFARDHGYDGPPYRWDEERRFWLRAELDAAYFHLYGLAPDEVDHVMESFWLVRQRDEKAHGSYRTKLAILDLYQRMADAAAKGHDYATVLDPPPADPSIAHPPLTPEQREQLAPILERALAAPAEPEPAPTAPTPASSPTTKPKRARSKPAPSTEPEHADTLPLFGHRPNVDYAKTAAAAEAPLLAAADAPDNVRSSTPFADDPDSIRHLLAIEDPAITPDMIAVLRVLRRTDAPLGKAELLAAADLDAARWNATIDPLLDLGLVAKTGRGRGVKYLVIK